MSLYAYEYCEDCKKTRLFSYPCKQPEFGLCTVCDNVWEKTIDKEYPNPLPIGILRALKEIQEDL